LWSKLIRDYAKDNKTWMCLPSKLPVWENTKIQRRLGIEGQAAVISKMISEGHAAWESQEDAHESTVAAISKGGRLRLMWQSPSNIAGDLWNHAKENGMMGQVFTVYELHSGDMAERTPFFKMDPYV
jgi:hypothetical protein